LIPNDVLDGGLGLGSAGVIWLSSLRELFGTHELFASNWRREHAAAQIDPWTCYGRTFAKGTFYNAIHPFDAYAADDQVFLLDDGKSLNTIRIYQLAPAKIDTFELAIPDYVELVVKLRGSRNGRRSPKPTVSHPLTIREAIELRSRSSRGTNIRGQS
jgi:hypothetical protein